MTAVQAPVSFGAWVRARRRQLNLTQAGLGQHAGCSEAAIRKIEADERKPSRQLAELLADALQIPAEQRDAFLQSARGVLVEELPLETGASRHNLPALLTSTVNRARDLASVTTLLKDPTVHLVTLIGPPGIGKTRLSVECGYALLGDFADGVWFVDLAEVACPQFFLPALARGLPDLGLPPSPDLNQLSRALRPLRALLILDNFEQIVEGAALDVAGLLQVCPQVKLLVTSRVPLHLYGEHEYPLPPLSLSPPEAAPASLMDFEAVQLFVARVRQHQPAFAVTAENAQAIITVCTLLDGIPLAIELAAASLRQMSLEELANLLRRGGWLTQIASPARDLSARQRTLESVIDRSYTLLAPPQQEFFCALGVFSGWFDAQAASAVCETPPEKTGSLLSALSDNSLLARESLHGQSHWRMLEIIHEYALAKLPAERRAETEARRAEYFAQTLRQLRQGESSSAARQAYYRLHIPNLLASFRWAIEQERAELGFQFLDSLDEVWSEGGFLPEGLALTHALLRLPDASPPRERIRRLNSAADLAWQQADFDSALSYAQESLKLGRAQGWNDVICIALNRLGRIYIEQEHFNPAVEALQEAASLAHEHPEWLNPAIPLAQLGEIALFQNRLEESRALLTHALEHLEPSMFIFQAIAATDLAEIALLQGDLPQARRWLELARPPASQHIRRSLVFLCALAGYLTLSSTDPAALARAVSLYAAIEALSERSGVRLISFYRVLNQERKNLLRQKLSAQAWQQAEALGRSWNREQAWQVGEMFRQAPLDIPT
ncbi:MAG: XRE family transcriptional regulator [Anaerolineae bacterium]|nr:MAG: XRE family transcriptional regulator [Anaerolineae bacterium]